MAPESEEKTLVKPFAQQVKTMFSFYLGKTGNLMVGGYDLSKYAFEGSQPEDITWTNLVGEGWTIPMNMLRFKGGNYIHLKSEEITLDTGLSYALVPPRDIESIMEVLKKQNNKT